MVRNLPAKYRQPVVFAILIAGFISFGFVALATLFSLRVNGPLYDQIVLGKDLIADVLPPPEYIIESYLVSQEMADEADPGRLAEMITKGKSLRGEFNVRHEFWVQNLPEGKLREVMVSQAYRPAIRFFEIWEKEFVPAILAADRPGSSAALSKLKQEYTEHRKHVDEVIRLTTAENQALERKAAATIRLRTTLLILLGVGILAANGVAILLSGLMTHDLVAAKDLAKTLAEARDKAEAGERAKGEFLATMSHEIRTPMNGIIGMTGLLLDTALNPEQKEYAQTVRNCGEGLLSVINDVLDFSKIESGKMQLEIIGFELATMIEEAVDVVSFKAEEKGLDLLYMIHGGIPERMKGDPGRLRQILINLAGNAVKFSERGEVLIDVRREEEDDTSITLCFSVTDTGIGIPADRQHLLFGSFSQVDSSDTRKHGGTGLGLAISKKLTTLMGGRIGVESEPGKGSRFWVILRLEKDAAADHGERDFARMDLSGKRVLIADDTATNRKILLHQLGGAGCVCDAASDGLMALDMFRAAFERKQPYDVAIIDHQMPGLDGLELGARIQGDGIAGPTRFLLLTSMGLRGDAAKAQGSGFTAYLVKPTRQSVLLQSLREILANGPPPGMEGAEPEIVTQHVLAEHRHKLRILVAEDNAVNQKVIIKILEKLGYYADVVGNGLEVLDAIRRVPYDLVLMDCQMPEMDGFEATRRIRALDGVTGRIPIIALTANAMAGDREKCVECGMDNYLTKPVDRDALAMMIEEYRAAPT